MRSAPISPRRDNLTTTTGDGKIELTEEELSRAAGGGKAAQTIEYLKIKLTEVYVSSCSISTD